MVTPSELTTQDTSAITIDMIGRISLCDHLVVFIKPLYRIYFLEECRLLGRAAMWGVGVEKHKFVKINKLFFWQLCARNE